MQYSRRETLSRNPIRYQAPIEQTTTTRPAPCETVQLITLPLVRVGFDQLRQLGAMLWVIDGENLNYSLARIGWRPNYGAMLQRLSAVSEFVDAHVFMSSNEASIESKRRYFASQGIAPHLRSHTSILAVGQADPHHNSDNELLLRLGFLCGRKSYDTVILGTGDGHLGCAASNFLAELATPPRVYTVSVHGATSRQLLPEANSLINGNLTIGADLARPFADAAHRRAGHLFLAVGNNGR